MPYTIHNHCTQCGICVPECPMGAIQVEHQHYWIDPALCDNCATVAGGPQCVVHCPIDTPPSPLEAKKGRWKENDRVATSPNLFLNGKTNTFASAIVMWEGCNLLAQRQSLPWQRDATGTFYYERQVKQGRGRLRFWLRAEAFSLMAAGTAPSPSPPTVAANSCAAKAPAAIASIEKLDIRSACLHLIYAAHAVALDHPWEQTFVISDRQIEQYLGLDKRRDLNKTAKIILIRELVQQSCGLDVEVHWPQQGRIPKFSIPRAPLWHLQEIQPSLQEDESGRRHLVGMTFHIQAGQWAKYFLNQSGCQEGSAFYQYGLLPKSLLQTVMGMWQQHEGAARIMLWFLFKSKLGMEQRITVPTLMRVAYGQEKLQQGYSHREDRKRLLRTFEGDLEVLNHYGLKPIFDPETYPPEIQPLWAKLADLPEDAEEALEFWMMDGGNSSRLTDAAPRGKWNRLMQARILRLEIPPDWQQRSSKRDKQRNRSRAKTANKKTVTTPRSLSGEQIVAARKQLGMSQRSLAEKTGKSQSWIRDVENDRFRIKLQDQNLLKKVLGLS
ncbi:helix-turn-helix domain-containing protein [Alkalinema sp. FACHB-956]|uniref:helix-turn-helix domain-containing protein n=1 Tax=Alkalinema sp. FACHB-956 TaxID=2692768 RepID=UPI001682D5EF|nr:helix-turn-helix domain-containing protein [Alkalinema sp. FACHB-956]